MSEQNELYYAEMEAARNSAEDAYFEARPQLARTTVQQALFRAGFERAFVLLWRGAVAVKETKLTTNFDMPCQSCGSPRNSVGLIQHEAGCSVLNRRTSP